MSTYAIFNLQVVVIGYLNAIKFHTVFHLLLLHIRGMHVDML